MIFKLKTDWYTEPNNYKFEIQLWDKDIMTKNDYLCSYQIGPGEIYDLIRNCIANEKSAKYTPRGETRKDGKFEIVTPKNPNRPDGSNAKVLMSIELLTEAE